MKMRNETGLELVQKWRRVADDYADTVLSAGNFTLFAFLLPLYTNLLAVLHRGG
jgi:hypothetical protein